MCSPELRPGPGEEAAGAGDGASTTAADPSEEAVEAGTSKKAVKAGARARTSASVVDNGYNPNYN